MESLVADRVPDFRVASAVTQRQIMPKEVERYFCSDFDLLGRTLNLSRNTYWGQGHSRGSGTTRTLRNRMPQQRRQVATNLGDRSSQNLSWQFLYLAPPGQIVSPRRCNKLTSAMIGKLHCATQWILLRRLFLSFLPQSFSQHVLDCRDLTGNQTRIATPVYDHRTDLLGVHSLIDLEVALDVKFRWSWDRRLDCSK